MHAATLRPLSYDPADGRPGSAFGVHWLSVAGMGGGALFCLLVPLALWVSVATLDLMSGALEWIIEQIPGIELEVETERILEEEDIIEARFVTLGRDFQEELPNREVPLLDTAPIRPTEVPTEQTPEERREETEEVPETLTNPVEDDVLRDVLNRSQVFAEIGEERDREGSPDGIEEGTESEATEGNIYRGRIMSFFRRGWSVPTTMNRDEVQGLTVGMMIQIGPDLQIVSFEVRRPSGNALFDGSVIEQLTRLQAADQRIPPPPEEVAGQYIGQRVALNFRGRQAG